MTSGDEERDKEGQRDAHEARTARNVYAPSFGLFCPKCPRRGRSPCEAQERGTMNMGRGVYLTFTLELYPFPLLRL